MGTNYYFRTRFKELQETYLQRIKKIGGRTLPDGWIHLGKKSGGWRFCWNPNTKVEVRRKKVVVTQIYSLSQQGIQRVLQRGN